MKKETGSITLGDKTFDSVKVDYDSYSSLSGQITLGENSVTSVEKIGIDND